MIKRHTRVDDSLDATPPHRSPEPALEKQNAATAVDNRGHRRPPRIGRGRRRGVPAAEAAAHPKDDDAVSGGPGPTPRDEQPVPTKQERDATTGADNDIGTASDDQQPDATSGEPTPPRSRSALMRAFSFGVVPFTALTVALGAAYLKYEDSTTTEARRASVESVQTARESTIAMLSYTPDTAQANLSAARDRLTGSFRDSYTSLTNDVVIPGAKEQKISATATVPAAASVSASANHAVVLVFVNQAVIMGNDAPTQTTSVVQVTLDRVGNRWLISGFDPK